MLNILLRIRETQNNKMQFFTLQSAKDEKKCVGLSVKRGIFTHLGDILWKKKSVKILTDMCFNTAMYFRDIS